MQQIIIKKGETMNISERILGTSICAVLVYVGILALTRDTDK